MNESFKHEQDELAWLAFQYVAGELSVADADLFEERLADDQTAREAVAEAVALFHTVCAAEAAQPLQAVSRGAGSRRITRTIVWRTALAISAAVLLALTVNLNPFNSETSPATQDLAAVTPALADAWSTVRRDFVNDEQTANSVAANLVLTDAELALAEDDLAISTDAPSWMTAAVLSLSGKSISGEPQSLDSTKPIPQEN